MLLIDYYQSIPSKTHALVKPKPPSAIINAYNNNNKKI